MIRCPHALRSYAGAAYLAATLAVSVAACGGDDGNELGTRNDPVPTTSTTEAGPTTSIVVVSEPPATTVAPSVGAPDLGKELASIDAELSELDAALKDFDQVTATTEGDPSQ